MEKCKGFGIFSDEEVNTGRQPELDLTKAVVIFSLAMIHTFVCATPPEKLEYWGVPYFFDSVRGGPLAAPMFMLSMGIGLAYSRHNTPRQLASRGLITLERGALLNVCRYLLPMLSAYLITRDRSFCLDPLPYYFFGNDILQFAGLAFFLMALFSRFEHKPVRIWLMALALDLAAMLVNNIRFDSPVLSIILGHFIGVDSEGEKVVSNFPLFIWFLLYASGYLFGHCLRRMKNKKRFYLMTAPPLFFMTTAAYVYEYHKGIGMMGGAGANVFYHFGTLDLLLCVCTMISTLGIYYFISKLLPEPLMKLATKISEAIQEVYIVEWIMVCWVINFAVFIIKGDPYLSSWQCLVIGLILSVLSTALGVQIHEKRQKKHSAHGASSFSDI